MAGEGQMLRAAREDKKWSFADAEETTKIRVRYIQALEEENYGILPGETYVKGYLRTYAKQLGLNQDEIIAHYKDSVVSEAEPVIEKPSKPLKTRPLWGRPLILGSMAILAILLVVVIASLYQPRKKAAESSYSPPALPSAPKEAQAAAKPTTSTQPLSSTNSTSSPAVTGQDNAAAATQEGLTAQLVFTQDCWVELKVDDQPSFQATFTAGATKEVKGTNKIELVTVGNAGGLSVTLNGKQLPSLGKSGQVVNHVVLTLDTLKSL